MKLKYFSANELCKVTRPASGVSCTPENVYSFYDSDLLLRLDRLRSIAGIPVLLTSGYRCSEYNARIQGSPTSSHLSGLAMDISCSDSSHRYIYLRAAIVVGFTRIGIGKTFIHLDVDPEKEPGVVWLY